MLARLALLLCIAGALGRRHRPAVVEVASQSEDRPADAIGDAALRDRLDAIHRARLSRLLRLRRQRQPVAPSESRAEPVAHGGPDEALEAPQGSGGGRRDYDDDDDDSTSDDGDTLYADEEEPDTAGGMHGGVGGNRGGAGKRGGGGDRRAGGRVKSSHQDPYTDVDDGDEYGNDRNDNNRGGRRGELSRRHSEGVNGNARPGKSRDDGSLRRRMDCIVDRVNNCIEWCRLKPTDTRLRQNRDNEPCRYWRGDNKNKWMQSGVCHNGRCG